MAVLVRGCCTNCDLYHQITLQSYSINRRREPNVPYFQQKFKLVGEKSRRFLVINKFNSNSGSLNRDSAWVCKVASFCCESGVTNKEEAVNMRIWSQEDEFSADIYEEDQLALMTPIDREELSGEPKNRLLAPDSKKQVANPETKLHFLEERDEELLSKRLLHLSRLNKARSALELYMSMEASGLQPNAHACNSLLSCLVRNGTLTDALRVFEIMRKNETASGHAYSLMLKAVANDQGFDAAVEMFSKLEEEAASKKNFDVIVFNTMISVTGRAKNWVETERIWRKLSSAAISGTSTTYGLLVSTFVQCGQTELALSAYHEMLQNGLEPSEDIMKAIIASCTKEGKWELGLSTFRRMLNCGIKPNIIVFNSIINCLGKAGEDGLAFHVYYLLKSSGLKADEYTWSALLTALYRSSRHSDALKLLQGIKKEDGSKLNEQHYNIALMACQRLGLWERGLQLLWQMEKSGVQISVVSYNHAISACEVAREPKVGLEIYRRMIHRRCSPDTFTYLSLIRACVWGSLWNEVEEILECVSPDSSLYNALIHGFCLRGKIILAKKLYNKMQNLGLKPDGKTRALMLQHLPSNKVQRRRAA
ncbi:pentatricopeptide repeat-containing protein At3g29290 [Ananas comosus]|uniref:Pentatricopeptide repeat-containing protein At3g29290 n=1 Tax=Ananas comosus TaxID=4615 RepID=A0A6P5GAP4_ANACO|nr:pentatricopeptide repeat-containing protein At3g29290 [Ananas comosus]XP_020104897.1 pentatricopeptide repeat-containing protein At3g29290 [Ananas comosus]XP_020104898.1 pentatricopeptide repeat-containing protein At3g29290 [Ananas comosus]XP_020104899.1 pentatricopeptide repeat-containing protein At3g29290 [Ananas comosus]XP_020104900.1 pentatricopeptide repeat-containing protein At3g29290 [Ananas comosus]